MGTEPEYKSGSVPKGTYLSQNVGWVSVFCVTHQALRSNNNAFFNECLSAHLVGYATNCVANPPYIDYGTA